MRFEISQRFFFDAAHTLNRKIETASSARIHGHTYSGEVAVSGARDPASGMVMDLGLLRAALEQVRQRLDHQFLDEVAGLGAPTLENLCVFVKSILRDAGIEAHRVSIWREGIGDRCTLSAD